MIIHEHIMQPGQFLFKYRGITPYPIVLLFVLFARPTPYSFLLGGFFLLTGELLRIWGVAHAGGETRSREMHSDNLITSGPYAYLRNPLYLANMLLYTGTTIVANLWMPWMLVFVWFYFGLQYYLIICGEEATLEDLFGNTYNMYRSQVPGIIPRLTPFATASPPATDYRAALFSEKSTLISMFAIHFIFFMRMMWG